MSHHPPYAMHPRPSRAPEHAAAVGGNAAARERVRRAMKLIAIAGVWVTGLVVVIAAVTMVAMASAPIGANSSANAAQQAPRGRAAIPAPAMAGRDPAAAGHGPAGHRTPTVYVGQGSANTSEFTIGGTGTWELAWSYDCAGAGSPGSFAVSQHGSGSGVHILRHGMAGQGVSWAYHDTGTHYLAVRTRCRWRLIVASHP
jgi:hypothetical protein